MTRSITIALFLIASFIALPIGSAHAETEWKEIEESRFSWSVPMTTENPEVSYDRATDSLVYQVYLDQDVALERLQRLFVTTYDFQATFSVRFAGTTKVGKLLERKRSAQPDVEWEYLYEVSFVTAQIGTATLELRSDEIEYGFAAFHYREYGVETETVARDLVGSWVLDAETSTRQLMELNGISRESARALVKRWGTPTLALGANGRFEWRQDKDVDQGTWSYSRKQFVISKREGSVRGYVSRGADRIHLQIMQGKLTIEIVFERAR